MPFPSRSGRAAVTSRLRFVKHVTEEPRTGPRSEGGPPALHREDGAPAYDPPAMTASTAAPTASRRPPVAAYAACRRLPAATTPPITSGGAGGFRPTSDPPSMRCTGSCAARTRSSTGRAAPWSRPRASPHSTRWSTRSNAGWPEGTSDHPVIAALVDAGLRLDLPLDELRGYIRSMRVDCGPVRITTRAEAERYMDGSAASVGRGDGRDPRMRDERPRRSGGSASPSSSRTSFGTSESTTSSTGSTSPRRSLERFGVDAASARPRVRDASACALLSVEVGRRASSARRRRRRRALPAARRALRRACRLPLRPRPHRGGRLRRPRAVDPPGRGGSRGPCLQVPGRSRDPQRPQPRSGAQALSQGPVSRARQRPQDVRLPRGPSSLTLVWLASPRSGTLTRPTSPTFAQPRPCRGVQRPGWHGLGRLVHRRRDLRRAWGTGLACGRRSARPGGRRPGRDPSATGSPRPGSERGTSAARSYFGSPFSA